MRQDLPGHITDDRKKRPLMPVRLRWELIGARLILRCPVHGDTVVGRNSGRVCPLCDARYRDPDLSWLEDTDNAD